ncbi:hypothetical protein FHG87_025892, partial [Trinorchestia longiramus]
MLICRASAFTWASLAERRITDSHPEELNSALLLCEESLEPLLQTAVFAQLNAPPPADEQAAPPADVQAALPADVQAALPADVQAALPADVEASSAQADVEASSAQADVEASSAQA